MQDLWRQYSAKNESSKKAKYDNQWFGGEGRRDPKELESKHPLFGEKPNAGDCVFFNGSNAEGFYFTLGIAQRPENVMNLFFIVRIGELGTFVSKSLHHNTNVKSVSSDSRHKTECGFDVFCVEPMRRWRLKFSGSLVPNQDDFVDTSSPGPCEVPVSVAGEVEASFDFEWTNFGDYFDFDLDISPEAIARSFASETWTRAVFDRLKKAHQIHYEQYGFLEGIISIGDRSFENIRLTSMRDHTITSYRSWNDLRRYVMIFCHLEDGTCVHTSLISMPEVVFSELELGYIVTPEKKKIAVDKIDLRLADLGEDKKFPRKFAYSFSAGGKKFEVKVRVLERSTFRMGLQQNSFLHENMCVFTVNGLRGWGFVECEYRISPY
ncbi:hypothetical protein L596_019139 [Steinernema carpocapsae]|uniref:DUF7064 domain-containing protein n=1 Tax=Steinernema carpocapsae TaxID=34508 RepID=A0A4U5N6S5_STECR|nr:hypothetical protein L596_019139 [Steinernema carpocapsae]